MKVIKFFDVLFTTIAIMSSVVAAFIAVCLSIVAFTVWSLDPYITAYETMLAVPRGLFMFVTVISLWFTLDPAGGREDWDNPTN